VRVPFRAIATSGLVLAAIGCGDESPRRDDAAAARRGAVRSAEDGASRAPDDPSADVSRADDEEMRRLRRRIADLERRVRDLEARQRAGRDVAPAEPAAREDAPTPRLDAAAAEAIRKETERLRERLLAGAASAEEARRYWDLLGGGESNDAAVGRSAESGAPTSARPRPLGEDLWLALDETDARWHAAKLVADGARGNAASFQTDDARIDVGPCPVASDEPFTLHAYLRTRDAGFSTALISRDGDAVGFALVMGREPGHVSFEAWSWATTRLTSRRRVDDGAWHEIEVSYDPRTRGAILSVDSVRQDAAVLGEGGAPAGTLRLGDNIGAWQPFKGDLDEVGLTRKTAHPEAFGAGGK